MVTLELSPADAAFLSQHVAKQVDHLQYELVHTDDRTLHRALAADLDRLKILRDRIASAVDAESSSATY